MVRAPGVEAVQRPIVVMRLASPYEILRLVALRYLENSDPLDGVH